MTTLGTAMQKSNKAPTSAHKATKQRITLDTRTLVKQTGRGKLNPTTIKRIVNSYVAELKKK